MSWGRVTGGVAPPVPTRNTIPGTAVNQRKIMEKLVLEWHYTQIIGSIMVQE